MKENKKDILYPKISFCTLKGIWDLGKDLSKIFWVFEDYFATINGFFLTKFYFCISQATHTSFFHFYWGWGSWERDKRAAHNIPFFFFLFATCKFIIFTELFLLNKVNLHFFYNKKKSRKILLRKWALDHLQFRLYALAGLHGLKCILLARLSFKCLDLRNGWNWIKKIKVEEKKKKKKGLGLTWKAKSEESKIRV